MRPDLTLPELEDLLVKLTTFRKTGGLELYDRVTVFGAIGLVSQKIEEIRKEQREYIPMTPPDDYDGPWAV